MNYKKNISILVDYAHEPESMRQLLLTLKGLIQRGRYDKLIHIVSCDGAGRDDWKKPLLGKISYQYADFSVVTLDNYNEKDNPDNIIELLIKNYDKNNEVLKYKTTFDRGEAFNIALEVAKKYAQKNQKVLVCSTGVGVENGLTQPYGKIEWDEKEVWKDKFLTL